MIWFLLGVIRQLLRPFRRWFRGAREAAPPDDPTHKRVVVLGGGVAGVCTAFWLSAPEQRGRYQVTLYTQGWRLGGKCASGRSAESGRIEEHGLHILLGCYHNAFFTLRACYDAWRRPPTHPFQSWRDAFLPQRSVTLMERDGVGASWSLWPLPEFPIILGEPGDPPWALPNGLDAGFEQMMDVLDTFAPLLVPGPVYGEAVDLLRRSVREGDEATRLEARHVSRQAMAMLGAQTSLRTQPTLQRLALLAGLGLVISHGYVRDVFGAGESAIDALNLVDFRAWLRDNGASAAVADSAPVRAVYDLAFAYEGGDASRPENGSIAAGVTLRFVLEVVFGYRNAPLWRMAAGTGDTVFAPMYQVLRERGVDVQFFHRVTKLAPSADGCALGEIKLDRQVEIKGGGPYDPLVRVGRLDAWPNQPKWALLDLVPGADLPDYESAACTASVGPAVTLRNGVDFDLAIVGLPPAILQRVAPSLVATSAPWRTALEASRSVPTRALQLWLRPDAAALGWSGPAAVLTAAAEPFDSWGDMSQVVRYETWSPQEAPGSIAYFCGCLKVGAVGDPAGAAQAWLEAHAAVLWPDAPPAAQWSEPGGILLHRYDRANTDPAELYVQTPPGNNVAARFRSEEPAGFRNLYVVGDWTLTRFAGGCFESAVESAMLAAHGISEFPSRVCIKTD